MVFFRGLASNPQLCRKVSVFGARLWTSCGPLSSSWLSTHTHAERAGCLTHSCTLLRMQQPSRKKRPGWNVLFLLSLGSDRRRSARRSSGPRGAHVRNVAVFSPFFLFKKKRRSFDLWRDKAGTLRAARHHMASAGWIPPPALILYEQTETIKKGNLKDEEHSNGQTQPHPLACLLYSYIYIFRTWLVTCYPFSARWRRLLALHHLFYSVTLYYITLDGTWTVRPLRVRSSQLAFRHLRS